MAGLTCMMQFTMPRLAMLWLQILQATLSFNAMCKSEIEFHFCKKWKVVGQVL